MPSLNVLEVLLKNNRVSESELNHAIQESEPGGVHPADYLVKTGVITTNQLTEAFAETLNARYLDLSEVHIDKELARKIPGDLAKTQMLVPVMERNSATLVVAVVLEDAISLPLNDRLRRITGYRSIEFAVSPTDQIENAIKDVYRMDEQLEEMARGNSGDTNSSSSRRANIKDIKDNESIANESTAEKIIRIAMIQAVDDGASDIIFESQEDGLYIRYRIDGRWYHKETINPALADELISVIKLRSNLDIAIRKRGQDGRMSLIHDGNEIDFRVNVFPIQDGENITIRILDNTQANLRLEDLGFSQKNLSRFMSAIRKPQGLILVTGPTGSGKSVTLYSGLNVIASPEKNTYTIEDPIEYRVNNVKQSQIDAKSGWTYPKAIESFMRAAPDNILVGEIRNLETARMALEAGMTGHLVLSTLHTNSAAEAAARLMDMGAEPDIVSMTLTAIVAQRLVRKLCERCKVPYQATEQELSMPGFPWEPGEALPTLYRPSENGCKSCNKLGFKGRTAAHEVLLVTPDIRNLIIKRANAGEIEEAALQNGMSKMILDGFEKVLAGTTTIEEVYKSVTTI